MNYDHYYHAGNAIDVFKHVALVALLQQYTQKEKPMCYFETHAGSGLYDLNDARALQTQESLQGIKKLIPTANCIQHPALQKFISIYEYLLQRFPQHQYYPGSAYVAASLLRADDELILCDSALVKSSDTIENLRSWSKRDQRIHLHQRDGYEALRGLLPPRIRRGLIFIDPPYEDPNEWQNIFQGVRTILQRFATAGVAIWYPIKNIKELQHDMDPFCQWVISQKLSAHRLDWYCTTADIKTRLNGCGLLLIQPPWQIENSLLNIGQELQRYLADPNSQPCVLQSLATSSRNRG